MNLKQALSSAAEKLSRNQDIENPAFESEVLLRYALKIDRVKLIQEPQRELSEEEECRFFQWIERRFKGEPTTYIIQQREFYGLDFYVDKRVLIPRPETELLVEQALDFAKKHNVKTIADIGTGSCIIAVSLAANLPDVTILATDISIAALEVARINCQKHKVSDKVTLRQGNLLEPLQEPVDIICGNLPYVKRTDWQQMPSAKYEPAWALNGGEDGLDVVYELCRQLKGKLNTGGCALLEIGLGQSRAVAYYLKQLYPSSKVDIFNDLAGIERVVKVIFGQE